MREFSLTAADAEAVGRAFDPDPARTTGPWYPFAATRSLSERGRALRLATLAPKRREPFGFVAWLLDLVRRFVYFWEWSGVPRPVPFPDARLPGAKVPLRDLAPPTSAHSTPRPAPYKSKPLRK